MNSTTLTSKGQITLPKDIRDRLALKQGDRFRVAIGRNEQLTLVRDHTPSELLQNLYEAVEGCMSVDLDHPPDEKSARIIENAV